MLGAKNVRATVSQSQQMDWNHSFFTHSQLIVSDEMTVEKEDFFSMFCISFRLLY